MTPVTPTFTARIRVNAFKDKDGNIVLRQTCNDGPKAESDFIVDFIDVPIPGLPCQNTYLIVVPPDVFADENCD